jgi:spermidine synthase
MIPRVILVCVLLASPAFVPISAGQDFGTVPVALTDAGEKVLFEKESLYHYIRVTQTGTIRRLQFRRSGEDFDESAVDIQDRTKLPLLYYRSMLVAFAHQPNPTSVLFVGMGAGTLPMAIHHYFPAAHVDAVELDPEVVAAAKRFFGLKEDDRLKVYERDGRVQVRRFLAEKKKYDVVFLDAFRGGYIPYQLTTREFLEQVKGVLLPGGIVVSNLRPGFASYEYQRRTYDATFRNHTTYGTEGNLILISDDCVPKSDVARILANAERLQKEKQFRVDLPSVVREGATAGKYATKGPILTDDFAPTDVLRGIPRE